MSLYYIIMLTTTLSGASHLFHSLIQIRTQAIWQCSPEHSRTVAHLKNPVEDETSPHAKHKCNTVKVKCQHF
jgi:hypothetical protein